MNSSWLPLREGQAAELLQPPYRPIPPGGMNGIGRPFPIFIYRLFKGAETAPLYGHILFSEDVRELRQYLPFGQLIYSPGFFFSRLFDQEEEKILRPPHRYKFSRPFPQRGRPGPRKH